MEFKVTDKIKKEKKPQGLGVYVKDDKDELLAGLIGNTHGNWLTVGRKASLFY